MYIPQQSFPINGTNSIEEFPAIISSATSSSPPSATAQSFDANLSPPANVSFAQMLKQRAPPLNRTITMAKPTIGNNLSIDISNKTKKKSQSKSNQDVDDDADRDRFNDDEEYYASASTFCSTFSLEGVFDRLKLGSFIYCRMTTI
jgi:hypothetical protein